MVDSEDSVHLEIRDDGNGFDKSTVQADTAGGLGLRLIQGLALDLEGRCRLKGDGGVSISIDFPKRMTLQSEKL